MRRSGFFWGGMLIIVGGLLLLANMGILSVNIWKLVWPAALIVLGLWVLVGVTQRGGRIELQRVSVPLEGAEKARVRIQHGVGDANVAAGADSGALMSGEFAGGLDYQAHRDGATLDLKMKMPDMGFPFFFPWDLPQGITWQVGLNPDVALDLLVKGGAGRLNVDLGDLRVTDFKLDGGVGEMSLTFPARAGATRAKIDAGVGELRIRIPEGVAARIDKEGGLGAITVDRRFAQTGDNLYQSPDYDTAENKIDLRIKGGVGAVNVR